MNPHRNTTIVLEIGDRFYCGRSKTGRLQTAWSLAGAKHFGEWMEPEISKAEAFIVSKGKTSTRIKTIIDFLDSGVTCTYCKKLIDGSSAGKRRLCKECCPGNPDCPECEGWGVTYCGFCRTKKGKKSDGTYEGELCPMCGGENVVNCYCVPDEVAS